LPIKIAVYDNGKLGFVEIEQKAEGMLDTFTKLKNPNFAGVARALGLWGETVSSADQLEVAVKDWLVQPGPALLHVHVNPMQLVMPPFTQVEPAIGMALYSTRAILHGRGGDVWEMAKENFLWVGRGLPDISAAPRRRRSSESRVSRRNRGAVSRSWTSRHCSICRSDRQCP
jgi:pyruvate dehydrogenase (quinone)